MEETLHNDTYLIMSKIAQAFSPPVSARPGLLYRIVVAEPRFINY